uniref:protein-serine/threonine phosphatase n=2 Tax=Macrostomum lignano TaxID=282301 RepID=A0A1I8GKX5_9PLAT
SLQRTSTTIALNNQQASGEKMTSTESEAPVASPTSTALMGPTSPPPEADQFKTEANSAFNLGHYDQAIDLYSKAIDLYDKSAIYYANRSFAYLRTECFGYALSDASRAIALDQSYIKAYYRRASANMALGKFKLALTDFEQVHRRRPGDSDAKAKYTECKKIVQQKAFEKAIAYEEKRVSPCDEISQSLQSMTIEDSYDGPKLSEEGNKVTREFVTQLLDYYKKSKVLHRRYAYQILVDMKALLSAEATLVDVAVPEGTKFTICGDVHGQFFDLLNIFELNGLPSETNPYLFNGDFVDRGSFSVECIFTLFSLKLLYPKSFFLARGNHESEYMNKIYGFEGEVKAKYADKMVQLFREVFNLLPLAHLIDGRILVMHGGLFSSDDVTLEDIRKIDRNMDIPDSGPMSELLWSDPQDLPGRAPSKRGVAVQFGPDVTERFCKNNGLDYIVRSHEVKEKGYEVAHSGRCITVFSAPNYCDTMGNKGAYITLTGGKDLSPKFTSFDCVPHPTVRPMAYSSSLMQLFS